jgi:hypothetical protein
MFDPFALDSWSTVDVPRFRVSLRIRGDAIERDFLTQLLGVGPTSSAERGDQVEFRGETVEHETGAWVHHLEVPPDTEMGSAIESLLAVFPDDTTLWEELTSAYTVDVHCVVLLERERQSTAVDSDVLAALGRRGLTLDLELRAPGASRDDGVDGDDGDDC